MTLLDYLATYPFPPKSRSEYEGRIRRFAQDPRIASLDLTDFTSDAIFRRLLAMANLGDFGTGSCNAWNNYAAHLRAVFENARRSGLIASNPADGIRLPASKRKRDLFDVLREEFSGEFSMAPVRGEGSK